MPKEDVCGKGVLCSYETDWMDEVLSQKLVCRLGKLHKETNEDQTFWRDTTSRSNLGKT